MPDFSELTPGEKDMFNISREELERITFLPPDPREGGIFTAKGTPLLHNDGVSGLVNVIEKWIDDQVERRALETDDGRVVVAVEGTCLRISKSHIVMIIEYACKTSGMDVVELLRHLNEEKDSE